MYKILQHDHANELLALSGTFLEKHESENNQPLGLAHMLARDPRYYGDDPPLLLSILENGNSVGVAVRTPPRRIVLSRFDADIEAAMVRLVGFVGDNDMRVPGVVGPESEARCFANTWVKAFPALAATISMRLRVFEARSIVNVTLAPGSLRLAEMEDHSTVAEWIAAFSREAQGEDADPTKAKRNAEKYINERNLYIWDHGGPVSIARESRPLKNGTMISLVYTPPGLRNRGFATSIVHQVTKKLLAGRYEFCSLFTNQANPASNHIYQKIGYAPLGDFLVYNFDYAAGQTE